MQTKFVRSGEAVAQTWRVNAVGRQTRAVEPRIGSTGAYGALPNLLAEHVSRMVILEAFLDLVALG